MLKISKAVTIAAALIILTGCVKKADFNETTTFVNLGNAEEYEITKSGTYILTGTLTGGKVEVEAEGDVTLILSDVEIVNTDDEAIKIENSGITTIKTADGTQNTLTGGGDAAINAKSNIILNGSGTLNINGTQKHGIECDGDITINGGIININSYEHGINSEAVITILGGDIDITAKTGKGIKAEKKFLSENGNVKIKSIENEGIESKGSLTINGGNFDILACDDGINAGTSGSTSTDATTKGEMPVNPADFEVPEGATTSGRGIPFEHEKGQGGKGAGFGTGGMGRVNADSVITINGGTVNINCAGDGIDSNGSLTINGGTITIDGPENSKNGPLDSDGEMLINGATVMTVSARSMTQMPRSMTQGILNVNFETPLSRGDEIVLMNSDKKIIAEHKVGRICEILLYTSPEISDDEQYTVYVNGDEFAVITPQRSIHGGFGGK